MFKSDSVASEFTASGRSSLLNPTPKGKLTLLLYPTKIYLDLCRSWVFQMSSTTVALVTFVLSLYASSWPAAWFSQKLVARAWLGDMLVENWSMTSGSLYIYMVKQLHQPLHICCAFQVEKFCLLGSQTRLPANPMLRPLSFSVWFPLLYYCGINIYCFHYLKLCMINFYCWTMLCLKWSKIETLSSFYQLPLLDRQITKSSSPKTQ